MNGTGRLNADDFSSSCLCHFACGFLCRGFGTALRTGPKQNRVRRLSSSVLPSSLITQGVSGRESSLRRALSLQQWVARREVSWAGWEVLEHSAVFALPGGLMAATHSSACKNQERTGDPHRASVDVGSFFCPFRRIMQMLQSFSGLGDLSQSPPCSFCCPLWHEGTKTFQCQRGWSTAGMWAHVAAWFNCPHLQFLTPPKLYDLKHFELESLALEQHFLVHWIQYYPAH